MIQSKLETSLHLEGEQCSQVPLVITGRPKAKAEENKKRADNGSGEKGMAAEEDRGGEKVHVEWCGRATTIVSRIFLTKTLTEGGIITQKRLRPCLFVHS